MGPPAPVGDGNKGTLEAPKHEEEGAIFVPVEAEAQFPGGMAAWARFLGKSLRYPNEALENEVEGVVTVQFVVDREGNVSDVVVIAGPEKGGLREEAMRVIRKSGKWVPANQNGKLVKSYKRQPVTFRINKEYGWGEGYGG